MLTVVFYYWKGGASSTPHDAHPEKHSWKIPHGHKGLPSTWNGWPLPAVKPTPQICFSSFLQICHSY